MNEYVTIMVGVSKSLSIKVHSYHILIGDEIRISQFSLIEQSFTLIEHPNNSIPNFKQKAIQCVS